MRPEVEYSDFPARPERAEAPAQGNTLGKNSS